MILWQKNIGAKAAHKMLMKLTTGGCFFRPPRKHFAKVGRIRRKISRLGQERTHVEKISLLSSKTSGTTNFNEFDLKSLTVSEIEICF